MSNSSLVSYTKLSPNKDSPRNHKIDTLTIHCVVGQASVETLGDVFSKVSRGASSNYGIGADGRIGLYVDEADRSWCSSSGLNDHRAITIECASDNFYPYAINDTVYDALIDLCADICKRNDIKELKWVDDSSLIGQVDKQNMTIHRWFANTACPGEYIYQMLGHIAEEVNAKLAVVPEEVLYRVQVGAFAIKSNADAMLARVKAAGFDTYMVVVDGVYKVQVGAFSIPANAYALADKLEAAGFDTYITTKSGEPAASTLKSVDEIAREVLKGLWGNGMDRMNRLLDAGYDYHAVQERVNELL